MPERPGVYLFKGGKENVLYVGKAKSLRSRLRSYFQDAGILDQRKSVMVRMVKDFSFIVTDTELEALILEANMIKQYRPRFNIILRDDKNYPYLKLTMSEEWPRIEVVRRMKRDGDLYFGPYVPAQAMWEALSFIRRTFSIRTCGYLLDKPMRPCIQYQMGRCAAPCAGKISREDYLNVVDEVRLFLTGEKRGLLEGLEQKMGALAEQMRYEEAAQVRDRIGKLRRALESQKVISPELGDMDVIGVCRADGAAGETAVHLLFIRNGTLIGAKSFIIQRTHGSDKAEILHSVVELFYTKEVIPPPEIIAGEEPQGIGMLETMLSDKRAGDVRIIVPEEGKRRELLNMATENARIALEMRRRDEVKMLTELKEMLRLRAVPAAIGAFDVSTIQGSESVGAFICWEEGDFRRDRYRRLKIHGVAGVDDYAMMKELIGRTMQGFEGWAPDLVVVDGGRGQLDVALGIVADLGIETEVIGVAKKPDRAFLADGRIIDLEDRSGPSLLLKRIRDEVHRAAVGYHRKVRDKRVMESPLEKIKGIGTKRRLALLRHFGSLDRIRVATPEEFNQIKGFNKKMADLVLEGLRADDKGQS